MSKFKLKDGMRRLSKKEIANCIQNLFPVCLEDDELRKVEQKLIISLQENEPVVAMDGERFGEEGMELYFQQKVDLIYKHNEDNRFTIMPPCF